ncbi:hypothetical protein D3C87_1971650 [compost metagenome]
MILRLLRENQQHAAILTAQQLAVKQIGFHRVLHADGTCRHLNGRKTRHTLSQGSQ